MNHKAFVRKIWTHCIVLAVTEFLISSGLIASFLSKGTPIAHILLVTTLVAQVVAIPFIIGFSVPAVLTMIVKMNLTIDMGQRSSDSLAQLQSEFVPVLKSLKTGISDLSELVEKVKHGNGELKDTVRKAVQEARVLVKDGESEIERYVFTKIDQFLSGAFAQKEGENGTRE